ncbi:unnamed protein product [Aureobasidium pullulans]|nr:unnamed protein product [Aureobasidium pullulans]
MPSQISEQIHRPKNITRKDIACFANAQQKPKLYSTNHSIAKDQNQMEMENKRKRSSNDSQHYACGTCISNTSSGRVGTPISRQHPGEMALQRTQHGAPWSRAFGPADDGIGHSNHQHQANKQANTLGMRQSVRTKSSGLRRESSQEKGNDGTLLLPNTERH